MVHYSSINILQTMTQTLRYFLRIVKPSLKFIQPKDYDILNLEYLIFLFPVAHKVHLEKFISIFETSWLHQNNNLETYFGNKINIKKPFNSWNPNYYNYCISTLMTS